VLRFQSMVPHSWCGRLRPIPESPKAAASRIASKKRQGGCTMIAQDKFLASQHKKKATPR